MTWFTLFQQQKIVNLANEEFESNLEVIGTIQADTPEVAIAEAKQLKEFKYARGLARHPILETL